MLYETSRGPEPVPPGDHYHIFEFSRGGSLKTSLARYHHGSWHTHNIGRVIETSEAEGRYLDFSAGLSHVHIVAIDE